MSPEPDRPSPDRPSTDRPSPDRRFLRSMRTLTLWLLFLATSVTRLLYIILITVVVIVGWLLFTTSGAQWLADRAMAEESRLLLNVRGGSLWNGVRVANVHWEDDGIQLRLERAELRWNPLCLLQRHLCLERVHGDGLHLRVDTAAMGDAREDDGRNGQLNLPVTARFPDVRLTDVDIRVDDNQAAWRRLTLSGTLGERTLRLDSVGLQDPMVDLAEAAESSPGPDDDALTDVAALLDPANRSRVELPTVRFPLNVDVDALQVTGAELRRGGKTRYQALDLELAGSISGSDVVLRRLNLEHPRLSADLDGQVTLAGAYPLDLQLDAEVRDTLAGEPLRVSASLWNSVADMELRVRAEGPGTLALDGSARPLDPAIPVDVNVQWSTLGWPLGDPELVYSERGSAHVRGDLSGYALDASVALSGKDIPSGTWALRGQGDFRGLTLERLRGDVLDGRLTVQGDLGWTDGVSWDATLQAENINASTLVAEAPDAIHADLSTEGSLRGGDLTLDAGIRSLEGVIQGQALRASGHVEHRPGTGWRTPGLRVEAGESHVQVAGTVGERVDLEGSVDVRSLTMLLPELSGAAGGTFSVRGPVRNPDLAVNLTGTDLGWAERFTARDVQVEAAVAALAEGESRVRVAVNGIAVPERDIRVDQVRLTADGSRAFHRLTLDVDGAPVELSTAVAGVLEEDFSWSGELERADLAGAGLAWQLEDAVQASWNPAAAQAELSPHCWRHEEARLCAREPLVLGARGQASVRLEGYRLDGLSPWLPQDVTLPGELTADVDATWGETPLPRVEALLQVDNGGVALSTAEESDGAGAVELRYQTLSLGISLDGEELVSRLELQSEDLGRANVDATVMVDGNGGLGALDGRVRLEALRVGVAQPFFPELRTLEGTISAEGTLSGTVRDPLFNGRVSLADGAVETAALPVTLTGIELELALRGNQATLQGGFRSGPGAAEISGEAEWSDSDWDAVVNLTGENLKFAYDTVGTVRVNPDLALRAQGHDLTLSGRIVVPRADIALRQLPEGAVRVSGDAVIVDDQSETTSESPEDGLPVPETPGWTFVTDLEIVLGDRVELTGFGVTGRLVGQLGIRQAGDSVPEANGEIRIEDGRYRAYGQRLIIRQGQFLFAGPVAQPEIYVEAVRPVPTYDVVAGLRVEGRPEDPRVSLFSEPAFPEEEILAYLILGRPPGEGGAESSEMMARAAVALGIAGGGGYATAIAEDLGVEEFQLDTAGEGDETQFVVGGYLSPNLYLSYGVGIFLPVNKLTLRYRLTNSLYLEAVSGLENALDLFYTFEF